MSVTDFAQLLTGCGLLINGIVTLLSYVQSRKNGQKIEQVHLATNSMKDALVLATAKENYQAGIIQGAKNPAELGSSRPE
jgi:hypothetical protein